MPPTPASLHHPGYVGEKSAFLAPFEMFYDALSDSKHLKSWLSEQLQKSSALIASLQRQQTHMEESVNSLVDRRMAAMREEVYGLRVRVDELETALRMAKAQGYSPHMASASKAKGKANGYQIASPVAPESYTFPPLDPHARRPEPVRRVSSPGSEGQSIPNSQGGSPVPFDRRLSVSATRLDPPRPPPGDAHGHQHPHQHHAHHAHPHHHQSRASISHLPSARELPPHNFPPPPAGKGSWSPLGAKVSLPTSSTRSSLSHTTLGSASGHPERPGLPRRASGEQRHAQGQGQQEGRMHLPEKRRASRSPEPEEDARAERGPPAYLLEQRRGSVPALGSAARRRAQSPMEES